MSRAVLDAILNEMQVWLNEIDKEQLHKELLAYFGLVGECEPCKFCDRLSFPPYVVWALVPAICASFVSAVFAFRHVKKPRLSASTRTAL